MQNKFIIDQEINLNDFDFLKTKVYADNLTKIIKNTEPNKVFTIGLFGNWGTGKSSIVKTSQEQIEKDNKNIKFVTYDAWQYVNDSFRRMFLRKLREELKYEETDLMKKFYQNEAMDVGSKYQLSKTRLTWILIALIIILLIISFIPFKNIDYKFSIYSIIPLLGLLITIISGAFHQLKVSVSKPHFFAPEQFEECFIEIVANSLSKSSKALKWVKGDKSVQNLEKLVIVIDNIDRCSNDIAYGLLTDIKTFFSSVPYSIVFVIPVDDDALKKHIINHSHNRELCHQESEEFLRKFFNVSLRIKPYNETDLYAFAEQIALKSNLKLKPETINVASKEYARNPRRIIQLFNNLLVEKNFDVEFSEENETLICCVLIIREEYPNYYQSLINSPKIFNDPDYEINDQEAKDGAEMLKRFIRIAQITVGKVDLNVLNRILTNTHNQFIDIPIDIKDAINTFDHKKVLEVWEDDWEVIFPYIINRISNAGKNDLIDTDLVAYFDLLTNISTRFPLNEALCKRIDENVVPYLSIVIEKTQNHDNLCSYALLREQQNDNGIKNTLINEATRTKDQPKDPYWGKLFKAVLKNFKDKSSSQALSSTFEHFHDYATGIDFSRDQIEYLMSDEYVQGRINALPVVDQDTKEPVIDVETEEYRRVKWIFQNKENISDIAYSHFFTNVIGDITIDVRLKNKTDEDIVKLLNFINPILSLIPDKKLKKQPETLYALIVHSRKMSHPSYPNAPQHDIQKSFFDDSLENDKHITEIIDFVINILRIANNETNVREEIKKLLQVKSLDNEFLDLVKKGFDLHPILDLVFEYDGEFSNPDRLTLLEHCFLQKSDGSFLVSEEKAKSKLRDLLTFAPNDDSGKVYSLFDRLIKHKRYEDISKDLIIEKDSAFINNLPKSLLNIAIDSFNKDNHNDYSSNFEFMSAILRHGSKEQKHFVVLNLTDKLDKNIDIGNTLSLIETMEDISSFDETGLLLSHLGSYEKLHSESADEEVLERTRQLIEKLKINS